MPLRRDGGRTDDAGVGTEFGKAEGWARPATQVRVGGCFEPVEVEASDGGHAASEDERAGVEGLDEVGEADAGEVGGIVDDAEGPFVTLAGEVEDVLGREGASEHVRAVTRDGPAGSESFEAAVVPVTADRSARQDGRVANLAGGTVCASNDAVTEKQASTNPGGEGDVDAAVEITRGAVAMLGIAGGVGVVFEGDGTVETVCDGFDDGSVLHAGNVGGEEDRAGLEVEGAG